ncbi:MAG TPA: YciI family protein [Puia sp.]|nr:YciI family protein [Puia sp.]
MIKNIIIVLLIVCSYNCFGQSKKGDSPNYDAQLAKKLGADEYGMKTYVMVFLKTGPNKLTDTVASAALQNAHLKNIMRLAAEGKLIIAGPFLDDQEIKGIFIFDVSTIDEAKKLSETDPAVKAGTLIMELHPWYGSAALVETIEIHKRIQRKNIAN